MMAGTTAVSVHHYCVCVCVCVDCVCVHCVGVVVGGREDGCYQVQDATGAVQMVPRHDIITDQDDADRLLCVSVKDTQIYPQI